MDLETYGIAEKNAHGQPLPRQHVFNGKRALFHDGVKSPDLIQTCSITTTTGDTIETLRPLQTFVLQFHRPEHRRIAAAWFRYARTLIGMNLLFDLGMLRIFPEFRPSLWDQTVLDVSYLNFLHSDTRPERSLKDLGPILGQYVYDTDKLPKKGYRFPSSICEDALAYAASDTHNATLAVASLASRCVSDGRSITDFAISHYTGLIWQCLRMSEAGIPMSVPRLLALHTQQEAVIARTFSEAQKHGLTLDGEGSHKSRYAFMSATADEIDRLNLEGTSAEWPIPQSPESPSASPSCPSLSNLPSPSGSTGSDFGQSNSESWTPPPPSKPTKWSFQSPGLCRGQSILRDPRIELTKETKKISFGDQNRQLFRLSLPPDHPRQTLLSLMDEHSYASKLVSSYTFPLLFHARKWDPSQPIPDEPKDFPFRETLVGRGPVRFGYPTWYIVPTSAKDGSSDSGGTQQGRVTCKHPKAQTFPKEIKACIRSRYKGGSIVWYDLSQAELRVAGLLSGDPYLVSTYQSNEDLHTKTTVKIYGAECLNLPNFKELRFNGKTVTLAMLYRAYPRRVQLTLLRDGGVSLPLSDTEKLVFESRSLLSGLWEWQERLLDQAQRTGRLEVPFTGQGRTFAGDARDDHENEIVNFPIQTTAGNILIQLLSSMDLPDINDPNPPFRPILNVYDALVFDCRPGQAERVQAAVQEGLDKLTSPDGYYGRLQTHYGNVVPLTGEFTVIPS